MLQSVSICHTVHHDRLLWTWGFLSKVRYRNQVWECSILIAYILAFRRPLNVGKDVSFLMQFFLPLLCHVWPYWAAFLKGFFSVDAESFVAGSWKSHSCGGTVQASERTRCIIPKGQATAGKPAWNRINPISRCWKEEFGSIREAEAKDKFLNPAASVWLVQDIFPASRARNGIVWCDATQLSCLTCSSSFCVTFLSDVTRKYAIVLVSDVARKYAFVIRISNGLPIKCMAHLDDAYVAQNNTTVTVTVTVTVIPPLQLCVTKLALYRVLGSFRILMYKFAGWFFGLPAFCRSDSNVFFACASCCSYNNSMSTFWFTFKHASILTQGVHHVRPDHALRQQSLLKLNISAARLRAYDP
jgi:hypothetical protein